MTDRAGCPAPSARAPAWSPDGSAARQPQACDRLRASDSGRDDAAEEVAKMTTQLSFPLIVVERPHQRPGRAWIARSADDFTDALPADDWSFDVWASRTEVAGVFGDPAEWPDGLADVPADQYPVATATSGAGVEVVHSDFADRELEHAIDYLRDDLAGLDLLESREEAEAAIGSRRHNFPASQVRELMAEVWPLIEVEE